MQRFLALTVCIVSVMQARTASARKCYDIPEMRTVLGIASFGAVATELSATWLPAPGFDYGIQELFIGTSSCLGCHIPPTNAAPAGGDAYPRFKHCAACHGGSNPEAMAPPDWLLFNSPQALTRNSYYRPGKTKAEAALLRAIDGSMPPGGKHHDGVSWATDSATSVSWCDEIQQRMQEWITAGYP